MWKKAIAGFLYVFAVFYTVVELFLEEGFFNFFVPVSAVIIASMLLKQNQKDRNMDK
ncbi:hypothetical protein [Lihuaxuella thermophila]|uniref:Uncharacterized protein n=1 Tax=Lihuaxuella thermophila TaxID=1173111 RepID=A0A1H8F6T9_9BACL|nr:hypothetical protein [Lihuaxuella thermophila]SEN27094.1 hypothetical protein SAMN05444955_10829 [Lihuaxuella thermophila]